VWFSTEGLKAQTAPAKACQRSIRGGILFLLSIPRELWQKNLQLWCYLPMLRCCPNQTRKVARPVRNSLVMDPRNLNFKTINVSTKTNVKIKLKRVHIHLCILIYTHIYIYKYIRIHIHTHINLYPKTMLLRRIEASFWYPTPSPAVYKYGRSDGVRCQRKAHTVQGGVADEKPKAQYIHS